MLQHAMTPYKSKSGKTSGVTGFETGSDYIIVEFNHAERYTYTYQSAGRIAIEEMKRLAAARRGLSTYISRRHPAYA